MMLTWHRPLVVCGVLMVGLMLASLVGLVADDRELVGAPIWAKPFKFAVSLGLYSFTLAWFLTFLRRFQRVGWWAGTAIAALSLTEMVLVVGQVVRGKRSHFNFETPLDTGLYRFMGLMIVAIWLLHAVIALLSLHAKFANEALGRAVRLGLLIGIFGLGAGLLMVTPRPGQPVDGGTIGAHNWGAPDGGSYMPITGWSTEVGDLRVPHFVGIHAVQVLPVMIALCGRRATTGLASVLAAGYSGFFALTIWQAFRGQPLLRPDALTLGVLAGLLLLTAVLAVRAVRQPMRQVMRT